MWAFSFKKKLRFDPRIIVNPKDRGLAMKEHFKDPTWVGFEIELYIIEYGIVFHKFLIVLGLKN